MQSRLDLAPAMSSREPAYGSATSAGASQRSPKPTPRRSDLPTSAGSQQQQQQTSSGKQYYPSSISQPVSGRGSPTGGGHRRGEAPLQDPAGGQHNRRSTRHSRSSNASPLTLQHQHPADHSGGGGVPHSISTSAFHGGGGGYYNDQDYSPTMDQRGGHHRSRSATRVPLRNYHSLERDQEREFVPIRDPRDSRSRERSLDRYRDRDMDHSAAYMDGGDPYGDSSRDHGRGHSYSSSYGRSDGAGYSLETRMSDLQAQYSSLKRELDATTQKLGSSMHSIKTFWSPELKKERALRKEEAAKYALINDQLKILRSENQKQSALIRQLEEELRLSHMRNPDAEVTQHLEALYTEKEHMTKEIILLRETIKELELRIETQKQTLASRDESIRKLMEIKGVGGKIHDEDRIENERLKTKLIETEARYRHLESMLESRDKDLSKMEELRIELNRRDQEIMAMNAKMKTLEEQHHDYQRHIAVLKESLCAKEEHYNMLQADVEELRIRLEEKNKLIEKKTQQTMTSSQDRNRLTQEVQELRDHMEIKDRKINVLQRKIENLEDLLKEKDNQVDMARARLTAMQAHHSSSEGALSSLEEAIGDKDKQISQLREQRDRAEAERNEERELHERELAEHRMRMHAFESDMEKLQMQGGGPQAAQAETAALQKQIEEKTKRCEDLEKMLKKCKEKMKMDAQKAPEGEHQKRLAALEKLCEEMAKEKDRTQKDCDKAREDNHRLQAELDRLLDVMAASEKEKFALNEQIREMQDAQKKEGGGKPMQPQQPPHPQQQQQQPPGAKRGQTAAERNKNAQQLEEARRREAEAAKEASKAQEQVLQQQDRIEELEEALRESVRITAQREVAVAQKQYIIEAANEKIRDLQSDLRGLQRGENARCTNCPPLKVRLGETEGKLRVLVTERMLHLEQLFEMKLEALTAAMSEKDSHLAFLEMSGIKNAKIAEQVEKLKVEKKRLMEKIKTENERRVKLLMDLEDTDLDLKDITASKEDSNQL